MTKKPPYLSELDVPIARSLSVTPQRFMVPATQGDYTRLGARFVVDVDAACPICGYENEATIEEYPATRHEPSTAEYSLLRACAHFDEVDLEVYAFVFIADGDDVDDACSTCGGSGWVPGVYDDEPCADCRERAIGTRDGVGARAGVYFQNRRRAPRRRAISERLKRVCEKIAVFRKFW